MMMTTLLAQSDGAADVAAGAVGTAAFGFVFFIWLIIGAVSLIGLILWIWAMVDVFKREFANPSDKTTWLIVLIVGFVIGLAWLAAIIYLIVGRKKGTMPGQGRGAGEK